MESRSGQRLLASELAADQDLSQRVQAWLEAQCAILPEAQGGLVLLASDEGLIPEALWPNAAQAQPLLELSQRAAEEGEGLITPLDPDHGVGIAWPVREGEALLAVAALSVRADNDGALQAVMRTLQWGAAGLQLILAQGVSIRERERTAALETSLDLLSGVLAEDRFDAAAMALVTGLATRLGADRVSLGLVEDGKVKVEHVSHTAQVGETMNLVRMIEAAMDEVVDQRLPILMPPDPESDGMQIRSAHERLLAQEQGAVMTLPLFVDGEPIAALMVERPLYLPFTIAEQRIVESLAALSIAALEEKRRNDQPLPRRVWRELRDHVRTILQPGRTEYKVALFAAAALVLFILFGRGTDTVSAAATLAPRQQIILAAPFDGYIRDDFARAGDIVRKGRPLAALDDSDLQLERAKWVSQLSRFGGLYQDASAQQDRVQTNVNSAEADEAQAQLDLANKLIARSVLRAPFDGVVVSGDLSQRIGGAVSKGDQLFTVARRGGYRIDLHVKESRIAAVKPGQEGVLHLSALPSQPLDITVTKVTPKTVSESGASYFVVEATLKDGQKIDALQPGMEGVGKVDVGRGWLLGIWTRDITEWLRLKLWSMFG